MSKAAIVSPFEQDVKRADERRGEGSKGGREGGRMTRGRNGR